MASNTFLDLPDTSAEQADATLLPLPYAGTVTYGAGTADGPSAVWTASAQVELWDDELGWDLSQLRLHNSEAMIPEAGQSPASYLDRVQRRATQLNQHGGIAVGVGGEHSLTPPLVFAASGSDNLADVTVVQFDAHADLRNQYEGTPLSHACAMRRLVDAGARLVAIGIRSLDKSERDYRDGQEGIHTFPACDLASDPHEEGKLLDTLRGLEGRIYATFDIDALEVHLCTATGTPEPGGLPWWQTLRLLRALLLDNRQIDLIGCDVVETAPLPGSNVNEFVAAKLIAKMLAYRFATG